MVLKLYGHPMSTCTKRVAATLAEKQVPFELIPIDFAKGEHKSAAFIEKQPFGQVPYIDDDGFILFESRAIARYIAHKYKDQGTPLVPDYSDVKAYAKFEQAVSVEGSNFDPFASGIAHEKVFKLMHGGSTDEKQLEFYVKTLDAKLDGYERILSKQKYLAGDEFTLADLFHLPYGAMVVGQGYNHLQDEKRPNVVRWWKDITSRPSWQAVKDTVKSTA